MPEDPSHAFVLWNSCSHDIDMLQWLLPDHSDIFIESGKLGSDSSISLTGYAKLKCGHHTKVIFCATKDAYFLCTRSMLDILKSFAFGSN